MLRLVVSSATSVPFACQDILGSAQRACCNTDQLLCVPETKHVFYCDKNNDADYGWTTWFDEDRCTLNRLVYYKWQQFVSRSLV